MQYMYPTPVDYPTYIHAGTAPAGRCLHWRDTLALIETHFSQHGQLHQEQHGHHFELVRSFAFAGEMQTHVVCSSIFKRTV